MKTEGEAIGHKGIGFKSVLELTLTPEIYSGLQEPSPTLSVGFDPEIARERILSASPRWNELAGTVPGLDPNDPYAAVPILRFPYWIEDLPMEVAQLKQEGFDTVVRLPFDARFAERLRIDKPRWLETVREACDDVSDQILLLLGCFNEVRIEDHLDRSRDVIITPEWEQRPSVIDRGVTREIVRVCRNRTLSSRWRLFRRELPNRRSLEGEIAVGIRVDDDPKEMVHPAVEGEPSAPFHLFFPTRIHSGLPFLLHAYFEVNAPRTGFYQGSAERNKTMLAELAKLARIAVADCARDDEVDLVSLVNLVAQAGEPEEPLASEFRGHLLSLLDDVAWIPIQQGDGVPQSDRPTNVFVARSEMIRRVGRTFSPQYIRRRTGLGLPDDGLRDSALDLVQKRSNFSGFWTMIESLCLPENEPPWHGSSADQGFRSLVDLFTALDAMDRDAAKQLLGKLRGNLDSRLVPTVGVEDSRILLPIPDPERRGRRGRLVMARGGRSEGPPLVPPDHLNVAFLPDGVLSSDTDAGEANQLTINQAWPLGVRPFTVDDVLDRLNVVEAMDLSKEQKEETVTFLWGLLTRARVSALGTKTSSEEAATFDPSKWFWCRPGSVWQDASARPRQQRERYLAAVPLPCRDGSWRPAGRIAFGADWANWIEDRADGSPTLSDRARIDAYEALEQIAPVKGELLAPPEVVLSLLGNDAFDGLRQMDEPKEAEDEAFGKAQNDRERHAFLLRLGVWEVPPIEAFQNATLGNREECSWEGPTAERQQRLVEEGGGWRFALQGAAVHNNVYRAEDYRFLWSLEEMTLRDSASLVKCLRFGAKLYDERSHALVFCPGCNYGESYHKTWRTSSSADGYPSQLAVQLRSDPWVPCTLDGKRIEGGTSPKFAWWRPKPPSGAGLLQSPWRLVPLCGTDGEVDEELRRLAGIQNLDNAPPKAVEGLLANIRDQFEQGRLPDDPRVSGNARQAFISLHRQAYERFPDPPDGSTADVLERVGVLCEVGERLEYRTPGEARHDDGSFAPYVRHFVGRVPFAVLQRDRTSVATRLRIDPFKLVLKRRGGDEGRDVTDDIREFLGDRVHELLSIMVHHSLGAQTLDPHGEQFEERARRIRNLKVRQVGNLTIDITVPGSDLRATIGEASTHDLFLEGETTTSPVLFHDFSGEGWEDRLRRKISPYLARVLGNPAYSHTFAQFLQGDEAEREEFLLELGISQGEADAVRAHIGVVGAQEQLSRRRWFAAILGVQDAASLDLGHGSLTSELTGRSLPAEEAERLVELGGGRAVRQDIGPRSALRLLQESKFDLRELDARLRGMGDPGLEIRVSRDRFTRWMDENRLRLQIVLETKGKSRSPEVAKDILRNLKPPPRLDLSLDPELSELLSPIVEALHREGIGGDAARLAQSPAGELAALAGFESAEQLDATVSSLIGDVDRARFLSERAVRWRKEIRLLAVLVKTGSEETRTRIRALDEQIDNELPDNPTTPLDLRAAVGALFETDLAERISADLLATVDAPAPERERLIEWAGIDSNQLERVRNALDVPRRERARKLDQDREDLRQKKVSPTVPVGLQPLQPTEPKARSGQGRKTVRAIKVDEKHDQRKRELGNEGERWALASAIDILMSMSDETRDGAVNDIKALLIEQFQGRPVEKALAHAERASLSGLDDEERIEELSGFLHVSRYSDAFGFDLIGWLPSDPPGNGKAVCMEVKSSQGEGFQFSRGEWSVAEKFHEDQIGDQYAILVVRREKAGGVPKRMDLLSNPKALVTRNLLMKEADGYQITYSSASS